MKNLRPQVLAALVSITILSLAAMFLAPDSAKEVVASAVTGIGMLGMKLLEKE